MNITINEYADNVVKYNKHCQIKQDNILTSIFKELEEEILSKSPDSIINPAIKYYKRLKRVDKRRLQKSQYRYKKASYRNPVLILPKVSQNVSFDSLMLKR